LRHGELHQGGGVKGKPGGNQSEVPGGKLGDQFSQVVLEKRGIAPSWGVGKKGSGEGQWQAGGGVEAVLSWHRTLAAGPGRDPGGGGGGGGVLLAVIQRPIYMET